MDQHEIGSQSSTARRRLGWRFVSNKAGTKKAPGFKATHFSSVDRLEAPTPLFGARYQAEVLDESGFHHVKKKTHMEGYQALTTCSASATAKGGRTLPLPQRLPSTRLCSC